MAANHNGSFSIAATSITLSYNQCDVEETESYFKESYWCLLLKSVQLIRFVFSPLMLSKKPIRGIQGCQWALRRCHMPSGRNFYTIILLILTGWIETDRKSTRLN